VIESTGVRADLRDNYKCTPTWCELKSGRRIVMKSLLIAISAATLLVAGSAAFAGPSEEAAGDYAGWKAARDAGIVGFPEDAYSKKGQDVTVPNHLRR
jgi:hypothetical protein